MISQFVHHKQRREGTTLRAGVRWECHGKHSFKYLILVALFRIYIMLPVSVTGFVSILHTNSSKLHYAVTRSRANVQTVHESTVREEVLQPGPSWIQKEGPLQGL